MIRTKRPFKRTKFKSKDKWYIAMEYLPKKFGIVKGPYISEYQVTHVKSNQHHCILCYKQNQWYLTHRKNSGKWKIVEHGPQKITMQPQKPVMKRCRKRK